MAPGDSGRRPTGFWIQKAMCSRPSRGLLEKAAAQPEPRRRHLMSTAATSSLASFELLARTRRTSLRVDPTLAIEPHLVERLVDTMRWAPNHHRTWPWKAAVVTGEGRARLGELVAAFESRRGASESRVEKARVKYLRAPVLVLVGQAGHDESHRRSEDRDTIAAGIQNLLLAATAAGLATHWATGDWLTDESVKAMTGLDAADDLVALIYVGWPSDEAPVPSRPALRVRHITS
ncbi:MAG: nitroreductase family protein [Ilumatobacteraceae bacterium]